MDKKVIKSGAIRLAAAFLSSWNPVPNSGCKSRTACLVTVNKMPCNPNMCPRMLCEHCKRSYRTFCPVQISRLLWAARFFEQDLLSLITCAHLMHHLAFRIHNHLCLWFPLLDKNWEIMERLLNTYVLHISIYSTLVPSQLCTFATCSYLLLIVLCMFLSS